MVGVERKTVHDLVQCMRDKRFSGYQLPGLLRTYDWVYLVVEGVTRAGKSGALEFLHHRDWLVLRVGSRSILYREVDHFLATMQHVCGLTVKETGSQEQTAAYVVSRYHWWTDKLWAQHDSYREIYAPVSEQKNRRGFVIRQPRLVEKVASQLPGLDKGAWSVARKFGSTLRLVNASVEELEGVKLEVNGARGKGFKKLGRTRAERIWSAIREE